MKRMDSLKRPETAICLVNTAALLGASIYFYRKINNLELELNKHSEHLTTTVRKVREMTVYKKHIMALGNAIKEINNSLGNSSREIETLKELVKYQSTQIAELQAAVAKFDTADIKSDIKMKENPYLRALTPVYGMRNNRIAPPSHYGQPMQQPMQQPLQQPLQQPMQQPSHVYTQPLPPMQQQPWPYPSQEYSLGYQDPNASHYPSHGQKPMGQRPPQQMGHRQQQMGHAPVNSGQMGYNSGELLNFNYDPPSQPYSNPTNYSDEGIDDEDTAIDAVRRARQQTSDDPLNFF